MGDKTVLRLKEVTKKYPGVLALDKVSFDLKEGEVHALIGENGAGKSTLIKCLCGAITPDGGTIELNGQSYTRMTPHEARDLGVEVVYQELNLIEGLTVAENVCFGKKYGKLVNFRTLNKVTKEVFDRLNVNIDPKKLVLELSTAQQQLVEISKSVSKDVKILVLDEPTAPLTEEEVQILFDIIRTLKENGVAIIYISHRLDEIFQITDRVTVMRDGKYVTTLNTAETNRDELIKYMVGRELRDIYPKRDPIREEPLLEIENVCGLGDENISLHINKGEIVGLAGLVGAGRTELARMLFGADKMDSGVVKLNGQVVQIRDPGDAIEKGIGLIPEDRKHQGVLLGYGIDWNIALTHLKRISKYTVVNTRKVADEADEFIKKLHIKTPHRGQKVNNLSGGNQQKVVLARTLVNDSDLIIFDEPTRGIDVGARAEIYAILDGLAKQGKAILMITSDMEELIGMSDRIYVLAEGHLTGELKRGEYTQEKILDMMSDTTVKGRD